MTTKATIKILPFTKADYESWLDLWQKYLAFYETTLSSTTIEKTWGNLMNDAISIYGFGAWLDNRLIAITYVVLHPNIWNTTDCCYLEDLYVEEQIRGQGIGRALIEEVYDFAGSKNCNRVYWVTQEDNMAARSLYDKLATKTDMIQYRKNL